MSGCLRRKLRPLLIGGLALALLAGAAAAADAPSPAYSADRVSVYKGVGTRAHVWTDGVRSRSESEDGRSGDYYDKEKGLSWRWDESGCRQMSLSGEGPPSSRKEERLGSETVAGHPTDKLKVTWTSSDQGRTSTDVVYQWRATDLKGLVIRSRSADGTYEMNLQNVVPGPPDPRRLAFPSPPCEYDEMADITRNAPQAPGGHRTIRFSDAGCKKLVPLPLTLSIPSDYAIRSGGPGADAGCFMGAVDDLDRVLASKREADFTSIRRGVFWCRVSGSTEFNPVLGKFVSDLGPQDQWPAAMKTMGAAKVAMSATTVGGIATLRVSGVMGGKSVYMLYLGLGDSPAILINYHPAGDGDPSDEDEWRHFVDSLQVAK